MRKTITAIAAAAALATVTTATGAMAFPHGGAVGHMSAPSGGAMSAPSGNFGAAGSGNFAAGNSGPTFTGRSNTMTAMPNHFAANPNVGQNHAWNGYGHYDHRHYDRRHHGFGFGFGGLYAYGGPDYYDYYAGDSCYQWRRVWTPFGWRWRDIWICD